MPYLVRDRLFIGNIGDAAEILQGKEEEEEEEGSTEKFTHILSLLSSASISFFSEWRSTLSIPSKEIRKAFAGGSSSVVISSPEDDVPVTSDKKLLYSLEFAGKDLKLVRMAVPLRDMESENLLDYLDVCLDFIDESRKEGSVLVHCFAGVSRSAAIMTAYLMRTEQLSTEGLKKMILILYDIGFEGLIIDTMHEIKRVSRADPLRPGCSFPDALESLRRSCEFVCPNDGFLDQLKMYEEMGFKVDPASPIYKRFHLKVLGDSYNKGERIDGSKFGADPGLPTSAEAETAPDGTKPVPAYRCQKCRRVVALQDNVLDHTPGEGESCFEWRKRKSSYPLNRSDDHECSSIFVEPLRWMRTVEEGGLEGKLFCAHCDARLGYFNWSGIQCSCGSWITPAFQLHKSRVDISTC